MSQETAEVVRRVFELFDRGDTETLLRYVDPAIETNEGPELPGAASYFGHAGLAKPSTIGRANGVASAWS
jgi:ketosteroid isomerase-like protein